jgi:hypothetical protein
MIGHTTPRGLMPRLDYCPGAIVRVVQYHSLLLLCDPSGLPCVFHPLGFTDLVMGRPSRVLRRTHNNRTISNLFHKKILPTAVCSDERLSSLALARYIHIILPHRW